MCSARGVLFAGQIRVCVVVVHLEMVVVDIRQLLKEEGELDAGLVVFACVPFKAGVAECVVDFVVDHGGQGCFWMGRCV